MHTLRGGRGALAFMCSILKHEFPVVKYLSWVNMQSLLHAMMQYQRKGEDARGPHRGDNEIQPRLRTPVRSKGIAMVNVCKVSRTPKPSLHDRFRPQPLSGTRKVDRRLREGAWDDNETLKSKMTHTWNSLLEPQIVGGTGTQPQSTDIGASFTAYLKTMRSHPTSSGPVASPAGGTGGSLRSSSSARRVCDAGNCASGAAPCSAPCAF